MPPVRSKKSNAAANPNRNRAQKARWSEKTEGRRERTLAAVCKEPNETAMASRIPDEVLTSFTESTSTPGLTSMEPDQIISTGSKLDLSTTWSVPGKVAGTSADTFNFGSMPNLEACAGDDIAAHVPLSLKQNLTPPLL